MKFCMSLSATYYFAADDERHQAWFSSNLEKMLDKHFFVR